VEWNGELDFVGKSTRNADFIAVLSGVREQGSENAGPQACLFKIKRGSESNY
jgi:hypothetical protein